MIFKNPELLEYDKYLKRFNPLKAERRIFSIQHVLKLKSYIEKMFVVYNFYGIVMQNFEVNKFW